ncbi:MAG: zinc ribbon domain-containing protein, partial [Candidatus Limnocylindrales bacterium]
MTGTCPNCATPVTPELRFCLSCGNPLAEQCPTCSAPRIAGARFCGQCGTRFDGTVSGLASSGPGSAPNSAADANATGGFATHQME